MRLSICRKQWNYLATGLLMAFVSPGRAQLDAVAVQVDALPALQIDGVPARVHTQGIEWVGSTLWVTARREDVTPKQPLLLRTSLGADCWEVWNLALMDVGTGGHLLDHPGGMQSDGIHLWIPLAESRRHGRSVVCVIRLDSLSSGQPIRAARQFKVADHIGAIAVAPDQNRVFGASWDTETVWVWELSGTLVRKVSASGLARWGLGFVGGDNPRAGLTVQDWKWVGNELMASGLWKSGSPRVEGGDESAKARSRLVGYRGVLTFDLKQEPQWIRLPEVEGVELAHEGMAISKGRVWFLPEDLGRTNRLFSVR